MRFAAALCVLTLLSTTACAREEQAPPSETCLTGTLAYDHHDAEAGTHKPLVTSVARTVDWELWGAAEQPLATGVTDGETGAFTACHQDSQAVRLKFLASSNALWRVTPDRTTETAYSFEVTGSGPLGTVKPPAGSHSAWHITDTLNLLYRKRNNPTSTCWTVHTCDQLTFVWEPKENEEAGFWDHFGTERVILAGPMADSKHLILHEAAHWFQWQLYNRNFPEVTNCDPHYIELSSSRTCAWTEGFADAVAAYTLGDNRFVDEAGVTHTLVNTRDTPNWDHGDTVQGRVAASLLDLWSPSAPDGGDWTRTLTLMTTTPSTDFHDYFTLHRPTATPPLSTTGPAKEILTTHTIDY